MRTERTFVNVLRRTTPEQRYESFSWFVYNLFGSTLPIWLGGYILLPVISKHFEWAAFSQHGELALYSAAFLAPTLRLIGKDVEGSVFVRRQTFLFFGWIFLALAVALYSGVLTAAAFPADTIRINTWLLFRFSVLLFVVSILFSSLVRLVDFQRPSPGEFFKAQHASEERLEEEFDAIVSARSNTPGQSTPTGAAHRTAVADEDQRPAEQAHSINVHNEHLDSGQEPDDGIEED